MSWSESTDFLEDLYEISDFRSRATMPIRDIPSTSKRGCYVRSKPSIYDCEEDCNGKCDTKQNILLHSTGGRIRRGRGSLSRPYANRHTFLQKQEETFRYIREVDGLDYSNDMIERNFRSTLNDDKGFVPSSTSVINSELANSECDMYDKNNDVMSDIKLKPSPASSSRSTPTYICDNASCSSDKTMSYSNSASQVTAPTPSLFDIINSATGAVRRRKLSRNTNTQNTTQSKLHDKNS